MPKTVLYSRRTTPRAEADEGVYAFWFYKGRGELSHVRNLNLGGVFIETPVQGDFDASVELHFLVPEGQIHARAVVRHGKPSHGLGLKFIALNGQDRLRFGALMRRLYSAHYACRSEESAAALMG